MHRGGGGAGRACVLAAAWALLVGCGGTALRAQTSPPHGLSALGEAEAAADSGRAEAARAALERWFEAHGERASRDEMARARLLRARLAQAADSAELEYLWVAIDGGPPHAAEAWLRLAQLHLARGEPARARQSLERLRADFPQSGRVAESWLWSGVALEAEGELEGACGAWARAAREAARLGPRGEEVRRRAEEGREGCARRALRFTVQLGAFQARQGADALRRRAREAGFEARVEGPEEGLYRVRVGRFGSVESARDLAARLREAGFSAVIAAVER